MIASWEHFAHDADVGVRGVGATMEEAFEQAALALTAIVSDLDSVAPRTRVAIHCEAPDEALLFAEWLNAVIYEMAVRHMLFRRFEVHIADGGLQGTAWGEAVNVSRHHPAVEVKGATYTALRVEREKDGWVAQTVVDV